MDLESVARDLYSLPPARFVAARDQQAAAARESGDRDLSESIRKLRKPTAGAWLSNLLVQERPSDVERLLELGEGLRLAQAEGAGAQLRELSRRRREVVAALTKEARELARRQGGPVPHSGLEELQATLEAAVADPSAGALLRQGRLVSALSYAGMGVAGPGGAIAGEARHRGRASEASRPGAAGLRDATSAVEGAARQVALVRERISELRQELQGLQASLDHARGEVRRLEHESDRLTDQLEDADRQLHRAQDDERAAQLHLSALQRADRH